MLRLRKAEQQHYCRLSRYLRELARPLHMRLSPVEAFRNARIHDIELAVTTLGRCADAASGRHHVRAVISSEEKRGASSTSVQAVTRRADAGCSRGHPRRIRAGLLNINNDLNLLVARDHGGAC